MRGFLQYRFGHSSPNLMMASIGIAVIFALALSIGVESVAINGSTYSHGKKIGVCNVEVPTIDLVAREDRRGFTPPSNGTKPGHSKIEVCCSGYKRKQHSAYECEAVCDNGCVNGNCTAPNVCACFNGYTHDLDNNCIPSCPRGCLNGICSSSGTCVCNPGYHLAPSNQFCMPQCTGGCGPGGNCTAPETCSCQPGFNKDPISRRCGYHCSGGCQGGDCVGPNQCVCRSGYQLRGGVCQPFCPQGCLNGECIAPGKCGCKIGWTMDRAGLGCQAHCTESCLNGDCTGPNECTCKSGYVRDPSAYYRCVAHCPGGCENGQCSAPNFCLCNPGFVKVSKNSQVCVRRSRREIHWELIPEQFD